MNTIPFFLLVPLASVLGGWFLRGLIGDGPQEMQALGALVFVAFVGGLAVVAGERDKYSLFALLASYFFAGALCVVFGFCLGKI